VPAGLDQSDAVQCGTELAVADTAESVTLGRRSWLDDQTGIGAAPL